MADRQHLAGQRRVRPPEPQPVDRGRRGPHDRRQGAAHLARPGAVQAEGHRRHHLLAPGLARVAGAHPARADVGMGGPGRRGRRQRLHVDGPGLPPLGIGPGAPPGHPLRLRAAGRVPRPRDPAGAAPGGQGPRPLPSRPDLARIVPQPVRPAAARHRLSLHAGDHALRGGQRPHDEAVHHRRRRRAGCPARSFRGSTRSTLPNRPPPRRPRIPDKEQNREYRQRSNR